MQIAKIGIGTAKNHRKKIRAEFRVDFRADFRIETFLIPAVCDSIYPTDQPKPSSQSSSATHHSL
jgi:hypothetical protein